MAEYSIVKEPPVPHECSLPKSHNMVKRVHGRSDAAYRKGTVIVCDDCGTYWWCRPYFGEYSTSMCYDWYKVRWYHFRLRKGL